MAYPGYYPPFPAVYPIPPPLQPPYQQFAAPGYGPVLPTPAYGPPRFAPAYPPPLTQACTHPQRDSHDKCLFCRDLPDPRGPGGIATRIPSQPAPVQQYAGNPQNFTTRSRPCSSQSRPVYEEYDSTSSDTPRPPSKQKGSKSRRTSSGKPPKLLMPAPNEENNSTRSTSLRIGCNPLRDPGAGKANPPEYIVQMTGSWPDICEVRSLSRPMPSQSTPFKRDGLTWFEETYVLPSSVKIGAHTAWTCRAPSCISEKIVCIEVDFVATPGTNGVSRKECKVRATHQSALRSFQSQFDKNKAAEVAASKHSKERTPKQRITIHIDLEEGLRLLQAVRQQSPGPSISLPVRGGRSTSHSISLAPAAYQKQDNTKLRSKHWLCDANGILEDTGYTEIALKSDRICFDGWLKTVKLVYTVLEQARNDLPQVVVKVGTCIDPKNARSSYTWRLDIPWCQFEVNTTFSAIQMYQGENLQKANSSICIHNVTSQKCTYWDDGVQTEGYVNLASVFFRAKTKDGLRKMIQALNLEIAQFPDDDGDNCKLFITKPKGYTIKSFVQGEFQTRTPPPCHADKIGELSRELSLQQGMLKLTKGYSAFLSDSEKLVVQRRAS